MDVSYNKKSAFQQLLIKNLVQLIFDHLEPGTLKQLQSCGAIFADYGCSAGANSAETLRAVIDRMLYSETNNCNKSKIYLLDSMENEILWQQLTTMFDERFHNSELDFILVKQSFFEESSRENSPGAIPHHSVDVGWSSCCLHWIEYPSQSMTSAMPTYADGNLIQASPVWVGYFDPESIIYKTWRQKADACFLNFLRFRARDIKQRGLLVFNVPGLLPGDEYVELKILQQAKNEMFRRGKMTKLQCEALEVNNYLRTKTEISMLLGKVSEIYEEVHYSVVKQKRFPELLGSTIESFLGSLFQKTFTNEADLEEFWQIVHKFVADANDADIIIQPLTFHQIVLRKI